jgi:transposase-like protein
MGYRASALESNHCGTAQELAFRFALWAIELAEVPSPERIRARYGVSRATAYRWRRAWCDANGFEPTRPPRQRAMTDAEVKRAKKQAAGLKRVIKRNAAACRNCALFRYREGMRWGNCAKHQFRVQSSHTCNTHSPA